MDEEEEDPPELNTITRRRKKKKNIRRESIKGIKISSSSLAGRAAVVLARLQTNNQGKKQTNTKQ